MEWRLLTLFARRISSKVGGGGLDVGLLLGVHLEAVFDLFYLGRLSGGFL